jgi:hypothetical protein
MMRLLTGVFLITVFAAAPLAAQPSGGPYGPIQRTYEVPAASHVYYVAPDGRSDAPGTLPQPTTLESAIAQVVTGDAVILRGGIYRTGGLVLNQGITLQTLPGRAARSQGHAGGHKLAAASKQAVEDVVGDAVSRQALGWWQRDREGMRTPLHRFNNDMVFVDGRMLQSAGWEGEVDENSYYIDYDKGQVYIGVDPTGRQVEITSFDSSLVRTSLAVHDKTSDRKGPTIRGITFTQYAYRALEVEGKRQFTSADEPTDEPVGLADPSTFGKEVVGTVLENVTITFCSRVAGYFRGDGLVIRNSLISDTSTEGIYVIGSSDVLLERNIIRRNNVERLTGYYPAAVKIFNQTRRVTCRDNLVIDNPDSNGIWYDVGNRDAVFVNNRIENAQDGFFFEISRGAIVAGNVFVRCNKGVRVLNSADVRLYNNTFVDTAASFERNERSATGDHFGWHPSTGPGVEEREGHVFVNNLLVAADAYTQPLVRFEQPKALCEKLSHAQAATVDGNVYVRATKMADGSDAKPGPLVTWSPVATDTCLTSAASLDEFRALAPAFEAHGQSLDLSPRSVFKSPELGRYEPQGPLPGTTRARRRPTS